MVVARKPAARRPVATAKKAAPAPARKSATAAKPAPATRKAAPARPATEAKKSQLANARASKAAKETAAQKTAEKSGPVHATKKPTVTAYDIVRHLATVLVLVQEWAQENDAELANLVAEVAPLGRVKQGAPLKEGPVRKTKVEPEDAVIEEVFDRDKVEKLGLKELRALAADLAEKEIIEETKVKSVILEQMEEAGLFREEGSADADEDDEDEVSDEDAEEDEDGEDESDDEDELEERTYEREDLEEMDLKDLQELAEVNEVDWKGLDQEELINALLGEEEEESEEEDEEDDEEEVLEIDPDDLPNMSPEELLDLAKQLDLKVPVAKRKNKKELIKLILDELEEDDEE